MLLCAFPLSAQQSAADQKSAVDQKSAANQKEPEDDTPRLILAISTADYPATPGDVYNLSFAVSGTAVSVPLTLDAVYQLKIQNMGTINARNKTYLQVRQEVENLISKNYPMSGPSLTLVRMGHFTVQVGGETTVTDIQNVDGLTRVSTLAATNLTDKASIRFVQVIPANGKARTCDLFIANRNGDLSQNPYVSPGDRILIPSAGRIVELQGEVYRPGSYELLPEEGLERLVQYYGDGFNLSADSSRITLSRISTETPGETRVFSYQENSGMTLEDRDVISVGNKAAKRPVAFFEGALSRETAAVEEITEDTKKIPTAVEKTTGEVEGMAKLEYPFYEGETLGNAVLTNAGRFSSASDLVNAYVIREGNHIPMDLTRYIYYNDFSRDIPLVNGDVIIIPFRQYFVLVSGAVTQPGRFPYVPDRQAEYYINLAGGRDDLRNNKRGVTIRDINNRMVKDTVIIEPEMMITVPTNRFSARFNQYGPIVTTIISIISSVISILAVTGSF
jgi:protein involved in polysaccharide export with SLBB domain